MGRILNTIEEYVVKDRKKDTVFIAFNAMHAKMNLGLSVDQESGIRWYDDQNINWEKRETFKQFMNDNMLAALKEDEANWEELKAQIGIDDMIDFTEDPA